MANHVAVDIAAGTDGVQQRMIDPGDGCFEVALEHPVKLEGLPGGDAQAGVGILAGELVQLQPLFRRTNPAGHAQTD